MLTLDRLVNVLGSYGGRLLCCPIPRSTVLRSVAVHDSAAPEACAGEVFLAVGTASAADAVEAAVRASAMVVVVREARPVEAAALEAARGAGIALIAVEPSVSWSQLSTVVYGLVFDSRETDAGRGPTDLFALADSLAEEVGGPVTIEDRLSRVLAYSSRQLGADRARLETIMGRQVPAEIRAAIAEQGVFKHLLVSDEPLFVPPSADLGLYGRIVVAARAGRELIGSIWVESQSAPSERQLVALRRGAASAAQHLLRARATADLERRIESDSVIRLLEGGPDTPGLLSRLGLPQARFRVVAMQAHNAGAQHAPALLVFERATLGFGWTRPGRSALAGSTVYTLLPEGTDVARIRDWARSVSADLPDVVVHCGIGGAADPAEMPASRSEADECLAVHALHDSDTPAIAYDESWDQVLLHRLRTAAAAGRTPTRGPVHALRKHDDEYGTRYVATLHAWLAAHGDLNAAAARLGVHRNTIRYRLRQLSEIADLRLDDPDRRLALVVALAAQGHGDG
ncbi:MAG: helix-turn-helix domain-containing protein [Nocardiopsaceae bacterium]|nr:helix-turn-helix domain-containing protein [Nocardiopsaceae bacterium]